MLKTTCESIAKIVLFTVCIATAYAEEREARSAQSDAREAAVSTTPLDSIWSNGMPGTRDVVELGKQAPELSEKIIQTLIDASDKVLRTGKTFNDGFIVEGTGLTALQHTEVTLKTGNQIIDIDKASDVTLVFFTCRIGQDVQLLGVERRGTEIEVSYCFVSHLEANTSLRFALIPLEKLPIGKYSVKLKQMPAKQRIGKIVKSINPPSLVKDGSKYISQPFSFEVSNKK